MLLSNRESRGRGLIWCQFDLSRLENLIKPLRKTKYDQIKMGNDRWWRRKPNWSSTPFGSYSRRPI